MKSIISYIFILILILLFFSDLFIKDYVPVPSDILVGHYYPWKDYIWDGREAGYPIKNFHFYDQITQNYPWKIFTVEMYKKGSFPLWNPYNLTGIPHIANLATASLYPLNILFLILPFLSAWNLLLALQIFLAGFFMYHYLRNIKIDSSGSLFGAVSFSFASFMSTTYEFLIIGHTFLWVPLSLLAIDKVNKKYSFNWWVLGIFSTSMMILGGHFQLFLYGFILITCYVLFRLWESKTTKLNIRKVLILLGMVLFPVLLTQIQLIPLAEVISQSGRLVGYGEYEDIIGKNTFPWRRLVTLFIPDFFGNPATGNFWEEISYFEYAIYVGVIPLILAFYTFFSKKGNLIRFWQLVLFTSIVFMLNSPIAKLPYIINIPGYSSLIPVRLVSVVSLSLVILAAQGFSQMNKGQYNKKNLVKYFKLNLVIMTAFAVLVLTLLFKPDIFIWPGLVDNHFVALKNSIIPGMLLFSSFIGVSFLIIKKGKGKTLILILLLFITSLDLLRQSKKFNTFVPKSIIYPQTNTLKYLENITPPPRVMIGDIELLPANSNLYYGFSKISGYDSIHSKRIEDLLKVLNAQDIQAQESLHVRDLYVGNYLSKSINLVSPEYVFALNDIENDQFDLVASDGKTKLYKNKLSYPRVYLTQDIIFAENQDDALDTVFLISQEGKMSAVVEQPVVLIEEKNLKESSVEIITYEPNYVVIKSQSDADALMVFNDAYDRGWKATINSQSSLVIRVNYAFRGLIIPSGENIIEFYYQPKSFYYGCIISIISLTVLFSISGYIYLSILLVRYKNSKMLK